MTVIQFSIRLTLLTTFSRYAQSSPNFDPCYALPPTGIDYVDDSAHCFYQIIPAEFQEVMKGTNAREFKKKAAQACRNHGNYLPLLRNADLYNHFYNKVKERYPDAMAVTGITHASAYTAVLELGISSEFFVRFDDGSDEAKVDVRNVYGTGRHWYGTGHGKTTGDNVPYPIKDYPQYSDELTCVETKTGNLISHSFGHYMDFSKIYLIYCHRKIAIDEIPTKWPNTTTTPATTTTTPTTTSAAIIEETTMESITESESMTIDTPTTTQSTTKKPMPSSTDKPTVKGTAAHELGKSKVIILIMIGSLINQYVKE